MESEDDSLKLENLPWSKSSSFKFCPLKKKYFWRPEAVALRKLLIIMMIAHIFLLVFCDLYAYNFEVIGIIVDTLLIWLNYVNYMTLHKLFCIAHIMILAAQPFQAIARI